MILPAGEYYWCTSLEPLNYVRGTLLRVDAENALPRGCITFETGKSIELRVNRPWSSFRHGDPSASELSTERFGKCAHKML